eukprot:UN3812
MCSKVCSVIHCYIAYQLHCIYAEFTSMHVTTPWASRHMNCTFHRCQWIHTGTSHLIQYKQTTIHVSNVQQ